MFLGIWLLIMMSIWNEARLLPIEKFSGDTSGYIINWEQQIIEINTARAEDNLNFRNSTLFLHFFFPNLNFKIFI